MAEFSRTQYTYNGLVINDQVSDATKFVLLDASSLADTLVENTEDTLPTDAGIVDYGSKFAKGTFVLPLTLYASTEGKMRQLVQTVKTAFNPDLAEASATYGEATVYGGYLPFTWTETVGVTNMAFRVWLKPTEVPKIQFDSMSGLIIPAVVSLKARDPRKYSQTATTLNGAGTAVNYGDYPTPLVITLTATGTTSTSLQITNSTSGESIYITTALTVGQSLVLDTRLHSAKLGGVEKRSYIGSNTTWWSLKPGNNTITLSNDTNVTTSLSWYSAWTL